MQYFDTRHLPGICCGLRSLFAAGERSFVPTFVEIEILEGL